MKKVIVGIVLFLLGLAVGAGAMLFVVDYNNASSEKESAEKIPAKVTEFVDNISSDVEFVIGYYETSGDYDVKTTIGLWVDDSVTNKIPSYITVSNFSKTDYQEFMKLDPSQSFYYTLADSKEDMEESMAEYGGSGRWVWVYYDDGADTITFGFVGEPPFLILLNNDWGIWLDGFVSERQH